MGILVCTSEIYGTAVFVIAETMDGFKHIVIVSKILPSIIKIRIVMTSNSNPTHALSILEKILL